MNRLDLEVSALLIGWPFWLLPSIGMSCLAFVCGRSMWLNQAPSVRLAIAGSAVLIATARPTFGYTLIEPLVLFAFVSGIVISQKVASHWVARLCNVVLFAALLGWVGYMASYTIWQWPRLQVLAPVILGLRDLTFSTTILGLVGAGRTANVGGRLRLYARYFLLLIVFVLSSLLVHYLSEDWRYWEFWSTFFASIVPWVYGFPLLLILAWTTGFLSRLPTRARPMLSAVLIILAVTVLAGDQLGLTRFLPSRLGYFLPVLALTLFFAWRRLRRVHVEGVPAADQVAALALFFMPVNDVVWTVGAALLGGLSVADRKTTELKPSALYIIMVTLGFYSCFRAAVYFGVVQHTIDTGWRFFIEITLAFMFGRFFRTGVIADRDSIPLPSVGDAITSVERAG